MSRQLALTTLLLALLLALPGILAAESSWPEWLGLDWDESDDLNEILAIEELSPLDTSNADRMQLLSLPGYSPADVERLIQSRSAFPPGTNLKPPDRRPSTKPRIAISSRTLVGRNYGAQAYAEAGRYSGVPLNYTQRISCRAKELRFGLTIDHDAGETEWNDFTRGYLRWERGRWAVTAGDFHVTVGAGLAIWTQPSLNIRLGGFRPAREDVRPAGDALQNTALRGIAVQGGFSSLSFTAFRTWTQLDAVKTMDGGLDHLDYSGLHQTDSQLDNCRAAYEVVQGGVIRGWLLNNDRQQAELRLCLVNEHYQPGFSATPTDRDRFPLSGDDFTNCSAGFGFGGQATAVGGEIAFDREERSSWALNGSRSFPGEKPLTLDLALFSIPVGVQNPRLAALPEGSIDTGCRGGSVSLSGRNLTRWVAWWRSYLEIDYLPWRGYSLPEPSARSRFSLEGCSNLSESWSLETRLRRRSSTEGHGEEAASEQYIDEKLRLKLNRDDPGILKRLTGWVEGTRYTGESIVGEWGVVVGAEQNFEKSLSSKTGWTLETTLTEVWFSTEGRARLYLVEAALPGRMRSVAMSGQGWRGSLTAQLHRSPTFQTGLQIARAWKRANPGDLEAWFSLTYKLEIANRRN